MSQDFYNFIKERIRKEIQPRDYNKIIQIIRTIERSDILSRPLSKRIVRTPLIKLVQELGSARRINSSNFTHNLRMHSDWCSLFATGIREGVKIESFLKEVDLKKLKSVYLREKGSGKKLTLQMLMDIVLRPDSQKDLNVNYLDITVPHVIVSLGEIIYELEEKIENLKKGAGGLLKEEKYEDLTQLFEDDGDEELKNEITRSIKIHEIFYPLLKFAGTFISVTPIFQMLFDTKIPEIVEIETECKKIFDEFYTGAELERHAISIKLKVKKKWEIEEIELGGNNISRIFKKLITALNVHVISYLRKLKIQTVIDPMILKQAEELGIDFKGLYSIFGVFQAPKYFYDIKLEVHRKFSNAVWKFKRETKMLVLAEKQPEFELNLENLDDFITKIRKNIEQMYFLIPIHVIPMYSGSLIFIIDIIEDINRYISQVKKPLSQMLDNVDKRNEFYDKIGEFYQNLNRNFERLSDYVSISRCLTRADQGLMLEFVEIGITGTEGYNNIFTNSIKRLEKMLVMKSLSEKNANLFNRNIILAHIELQKFIIKWNPVDIKKVLTKSLELKGT